METPSKEAKDLTLQIVDIFKQRYQMHDVPFGATKVAHLLDTALLKARLAEHQIECRFCHVHNGLCKRYSDLTRQLQERGERT